MNLPPDVEAIVRKRQEEKRKREEALREEERALSGGEALSGFSTGAGAEEGAVPASGSTSNLGVFPETIMCEYNPKHIVPMAKYEEHKMNCPDRKQTEENRKRGREFYLAHKD